MVSDPKIAFVHDALPFQGGAEKVLEAALEVFPTAPVYTLMYRKEKFYRTSFANREIHTSFIDRLPGAHTHHRAYFPMMPYAIEQFDLSGYDIIISFSYAVAHGILPIQNQLHISYMHTPLRYAWQMYPDFMKDRNLLTRWLTAIYLHFFRQWDRAAAARVDHFVTVSEWMARCIWRAYHRQAEVLYPPVDLRSFYPISPRKDFYVTVSRLVAHKKIDLVVEGFNHLGLPLIVIGDGPELARLKRLARPNVTLLGWQPQDKLASLLGEAKGFIQAGQEDFGIAMVEAQAAGCPVIALKSGASREIIIEGLTGEFFEEQTSQSLAEAVHQFERTAHPYDPFQIRKNAERFDKGRFLQGFSRIVEENWLNFRRGPAYENQLNTEILYPVGLNLRSDSPEGSVDGLQSRHF